MNQLSTTMNLLFMLCGCLAFALLVHGQAQSGFISIDCGIPEGSDYTDEVTNISYTSDARYVDTGTNHDISSSYTADSRQMHNLRSFTKGIKNCYTIKLAQADQGNKYLIRAIFMYGNYDFKNEPPVFELYLDGNQWATIKFKDASYYRSAEIIHVPATAYIHVCLVNNGSGTPFISALELRPLDNSTYQTESESGSLILANRIDVGSTTDESIRYPNDTRDRIWDSATRVGFTRPDWEPIRAPYNSSNWSYDNYEPPDSVMATAVRPVNGSDPLNFQWVPYSRNQQIYLYLYFAEIEQLKDGQLREFQIYLNNKTLPSPIVRPPYLQQKTTFSRGSLDAGSRLNFSIRATANSTLPPILNALEAYEFVGLQQSPTNQSEGPERSRIDKSGA